MSASYFIPDIDRFMYEFMDVLSNVAFLKYKTSVHIPFIRIASVRKNLNKPQDLVYVT